MARPRSALSALLVVAATLLAMSACSDSSSAQSAESCEYWVTVLPGQDFFVLTHIDDEQRSHEVELPDSTTGNQGINPDISPDGKLLAYAVGPNMGDSFHGKDIVVTTLDGELQFQASVENARVPRFSPDGKRLAYIWHENPVPMDTIRVVDLETKEFTEFESSRGSTFDWLNDEQILVAGGSFDGPSTLRVVSTSGEPVRDLQPQLRHVKDLSVAPGGEHFAVLHAHNSGGDWVDDLLIFDKDGQQVWARTGNPTGAAWLDEEAFLFADWTSDVTRMNKVTLPAYDVVVMEELQLQDPIALGSLAVRC